MNRNARIKRLRLLSPRRINKAAAMWREGEAAILQWERSEPVRFFVNTDAGTILVQGEGFGEVEDFTYTIKFSSATDDAIDRILHPLKYTWTSSTAPWSSISGYKIALKNVDKLAAAYGSGSINFTNFYDSEDGTTGFWTEWVEWNMAIEEEVRRRWGGTTPGKELTEGPAEEATEHQSPLGPPLEEPYTRFIDKHYYCSGLREEDGELPEYCEGFDEATAEYCDNFPDDARCSDLNKESRVNRLRRINKIAQVKYDVGIDVSTIRRASPSF